MSLLQGLMGKNMGHEENPFPVPVLRAGFYHFERFTLHTIIYKKRAGRPRPYLDNIEPFVNVRAGFPSPLSINRTYY